MAEFHADPADTPVIGLIVARSSATSTDTRCSWCPSGRGRESAACRRQEAIGWHRSRQFYHYRLALIVAVVAGPFILRPGDDEVSAFGLMAALLLDATVVRDCF